MNEYSLDSKDHRGGDTGFRRQQRKQTGQESEGSGTTMERTGLGFDRLPRLWPRHRWIQLKVKLFWSKIVAKDDLFFNIRSK